MLDPGTIRLEHAVLQAFCSVMTLANWRINRGLRGMHWFFLYNLVLLAGSSLAFFRGQISPLYSVVLSNLLFATGYFLLHLAVTRLFELGERQYWLQLGLLLACTIAMFQFGLFAPDLRKRLVAFSLVVGLQQLHSAFLLWPRHRSALADSSGPLAGVLVFLTVNNAVRILVALSPLGTAIARSSGPIFSILEILNTCLQCATIVAYVWITAAMLRRDLEVQAATDPLTGLLNRRAFERLALKHLQQSPLRQGNAAVLALDLDGFKQINDVRGHVCGDEVLVQVADCLRASIGSRDLAARLGGDEFALFLRDTTPLRANALAHDVCRAVSLIAVSGESCAAGISASIGLCDLQSTATDWETILTSCDNALYAAKRAGGNRVVAASQTVLETAPSAEQTDRLYSSAFDFPSSLPYN